MQLQLFETQENIAHFSPCRTYRYTLWRKFGDDWKTNFVMFVGLNPSTADEVQDDPTIRRCVGFAKDWGFSALLMTNLFAFRATDPKDMYACSEPIGADNDRFLAEYGAQAKLIIAAWGNHGKHKNRHAEVLKLLPSPSVRCLKITGAGMPSHPLYLPKNLKPFPL